ncbi:MAG: aminodeoxychorismate synthase, component [Glaciihabitans sp.]|nr:aminodeoxychorismate synthase, component [Glaciihabitans sp.]
MRTLLIDNHDSYTFNLFQLIAEVNQVEPLVLANDDPMLPGLDLAEFDNVVVSPGPGRPQVERDVGYAAEILRTTTLPVLGVCLGHQAIGFESGANIELAPQARHGHLTRVHHDGGDLFDAIPQDFVAVRYHSLRVAEPMPDQLLATAWAEDGVIMGLRHRHRPQWGVQFHPESIASEYGHKLVANFRDLTARYRAPHEPRTSPYRCPPTAAAIRDSNDRASNSAVALELLEIAVPGAVPTEAAFTELFSDSGHSFWLDSSRVEEGMSRFSFLGDASGPLSEVLTYRVADQAVSVWNADGVHAESGSIFEVLDRRLAQRRIPDPGLPFDFTGGYVGYFGYEMKADCGAQRRHHAETPDAAWIFADRMIAVDHKQDITYVVALHAGDTTTRTAAQQWTEQTAMRIVQLLGSAAERGDGSGDLDDAPDPRPHLVRETDGYLRDIEACRRQLVAGESYEICLTNKVRMRFDDDDIAFYRRLRRANPAPYAALLRLGGVTVFSSSPERFLKIDGNGIVESKPIKGTAPRSADPVRDAALAAELATSAKTNAENLMIVDLLRNDLGRISRIGSVHVPSYMAVESYATVHQLVSTVCASLRPEFSAVGSVRCCFPGGSMTGAPKLRSMEIIDELETEARGIYSGALGYFGLAGGADLSIVIRTAVRVGDNLSVGAGGAIVLDSDPAEEVDEMLLKCAASMRALRAGERC